MFNRMSTSTSNLTEVLDTSSLHFPRLVMHAVMRCRKGETEVCWLGEEVERPQSAYEKAFYPRSNFSRGSILWLEYLSATLGQHIHHAICGHGGERWIAGSPVDGYDPTTGTVYEYHGCYYHGCPTHCERDEAAALYKKTRQREQRIRDAGHELVVVWQCQRPLLPAAARAIPKPKTELYPHPIVFDFEAYLDKTAAQCPTVELTNKNRHVPISVSVGDSLNPQPTHICDADPAAMIAAFMAELQRRAALLRADVEARFLPKDLELLPQGQQRKIREWCTQVPVLGFNSGCYDLNLVKEHFADELAATCAKAKVASNGSKTMFIITPGFRFLDICSYLLPGTSYDTWVKAYGCDLTKSWFPYDWFDSPVKLDYPGLPDYPAWYSHQKEGYLLTLEQWKTCKRVFREKGMTTFADWLRYYNDLDVAPFIEALQKMRSFYLDRGVDILKDAVSLPGVAPV